MFQTTNQYEFSIASIFPFLEVWHGLTPLASSVEPRYGTSLIFSKAQNGRNTVTVTVTSQVVVGRLSSKIVTVDKDVLMKLMLYNHGWGWDKSINKYLCFWEKLGYHENFVSPISQIRLMRHSGIYINQQHCMAHCDKVNNKSWMGAINHPQLVGLLLGFPHDCDSFELKHALLWGPGMSHELYFKEASTSILAPTKLERAQGWKTHFLAGPCLLVHTYSLHLNIEGGNGCRSQHVLCGDASGLVYV